MTDSTENNSGTFLNNRVILQTIFKENEYHQKYLHSFNVKIFPARKCQQLRPNDRERWQMNLKKFVLLVLIIMLTSYIFFHNL